MEATKEQKAIIAEVERLLRMGHVCNAEKMLLDNWAKLSYVDGNLHKLVKQTKNDIMVYGL